MHIAVVEHSRAETAPPLSHLSAVIVTPLADPHHTGGRARVAHDTRATRARWHERTFSPTFRTLGEIHRLRSPRWRLPRRPAQPPWPYSTLMAPSRRRDASRRRICVPTGGRCGIVFPPSRVSTPLCNAPAHRRRVLARGADIEHTLEPFSSRHVEIPLRLCGMPFAVVENLLAETPPPLSPTALANPRHKHTKISRKQRERARGRHRDLTSRPRGGRARPPPEPQTEKLASSTTFAHVGARVACGTAQARARDGRRMACGWQRSRRPSPLLSNPCEGLRHIRDVKMTEQVLPPRRAAGHGTK